MVQERIVSHNLAHMHKVSFILPAYKRRFLKEAIDSILAQTCRDFELVMVDDKSPEELYEVIKEFSWEKDFEKLSDGGRKWSVDGIAVRYYQNAENIGGNDLVAMWNFAMGYATGEWCVLASDDDVYDPGYLHEMLNLQSKFPTCDLFHSRIAVIGTDGKWLRVGEQRIEFESQVQMVYSRGVLRNWQTAQEFLFRKTALEKIGGFVNFPLAWYSDDATWMALARNGCACSSQILFHFRQSGNNISSRYGATVATKVKAADLFKSWFRDFSKTLCASSQEEQYIMQDLADKVDYSVDALTRMFVRGVPGFGEWYRILRSSAMSMQAKRSCVYDRFRFLLALRLLLPVRL